jgi:hypothetical protein
MPPRLLSPACTCLSCHLCAPPATARLPEPPDAAQQEPAAENRVHNPRAHRTEHHRDRLARRQHQEDQPEHPAHPGAETRVSQRLRHQAIIGHRPAPLNQLGDLPLICRARISDRPVGPIARAPSAWPGGIGHPHRLQAQRRTTQTSATTCAASAEGASGGALRLRDDLKHHGGLRVRSRLGQVRPSRPPSTRGKPSRPGPAGQGRSSSGALHLDPRGLARSPGGGSTADGMTRRTGAGGNAPCPLRARSAGQCGGLTVTRGYAAIPDDLRPGRSRLSGRRSSKQQVSGPSSSEVSRGATRSQGRTPRVCRTEWTSRSGSVPRGRNCSHRHN